MFTNYTDEPFGGSPWHGPRRGYGRPFQGRRVMPLLAAAFLAGAALRRRSFDYGAGPHGPGGHGHGPGVWGHRGWGDGPRPDAFEGRRHGGPWGHGGPGDREGREGREGRGGWRGGRGHGGPPPAARILLPEIGALVALLRATRRRGGPSAGQVDQIRAVIADARTRIAAILADTPDTRSPGSLV